MDAMFFVIILSVAVSAIFAYMPQEQDGLTAEQIHNDLMKTELRICDVFDVDDTRTVEIEWLIAAHLSSGKGNIEEYIQTVLRSIVPMVRDFMFTCTFDGKTMVIGFVETYVSSYNAETDIAGSVLKTSLMIS